MTRNEKEELSILIESAINGCLATNDSELYEGAQQDIARIYELLDKIPDN